MIAVSIRDSSKRDRVPHEVVCFFTYMLDEMNMILEVISEEMGTPGTEEEILEQMEAKIKEANNMKASQHEVTIAVARWIWREKDEDSEMETDEVRTAWLSTYATIKYGPAALQAYNRYNAPIKERTALLRLLQEGGGYNRIPEFISEGHKEVYQREFEDEYEILNAVHSVWEDLPQDIHDRIYASKELAGIGNYMIAELGEMGLSLTANDRHRSHPGL